jgi:hypothetical protein
MQALSQASSLSSEVEKGGVMRTWVVGIIIGACVLTSACKPPAEIPGKQPSTNTPGVKVVPENQGLLKPWDFTYDCVTNKSLGKAEVQRCRDELEQAKSDKKKGVR